MQEESKAKSKNLGENEFPCGFCARVFTSLDEFEGHKEKRHAHTKRSNDFVDEKKFGQSKGPFYWNKCLINLNPKVDISII